MTSDAVDSGRESSSNRSEISRRIRKKFQELSREVQKEHEKEQSAPSNQAEVDAKEVFDLKAFSEK